MITSERLREIDKDKDIEPGWCKSLCESADDFDALTAKLSQVEANAAVMREALLEIKVRIAYIGMKQEPMWRPYPEKDHVIPDWRKQIAMLENALYGSTSSRTEGVTYLAP